MHTRHIDFSWRAVRTLQEHPVETYYGNTATVSEYHHCIPVAELPPFKLIRNWLFESNLRYYLYGCGSPTVIGIGFGFDNIADLQSFMQFFT